MKLAILASGNGSNFEAIACACQENRIDAGIEVVITDNEAAFVRKRAQKYGIADIYVNPKEYPNRQQFDQHLISILNKHAINLVILAGYMRMLSNNFIAKYPNKILNIHPALLPAFKGTHAIEEAFSYGCKVTGVTVHFVDEQIDHGPIILQQALTIDPAWDLDTLEQEIHTLEHQLYPQAINLVLQNKVTVTGRKVSLSD